jgi:GNAT superfamily N-acetyltransferase
LDTAFPDCFNGRTFFKQKPHQRLLAFEGERLVGHVGLDFRVINVGGSILDIMGIIDLCVAKDWQHNHIGSELMTRAEQLATGCDFVILYTEEHAFYEKLAFTAKSPAPTRWLAIDELKSHSVIERDLSDCFMVKKLRQKRWPEGEIDLLGYLF